MDQSFLFQSMMTSFAVHMVDTSIEQEPTYDSLLMSCLWFLPLCEDHNTCTCQGSPEYHPHQKKIQDGKIAFGNYL